MTDNSDSNIKQIQEMGNAFTDSISSSVKETYNKMFDNSNIYIGLLVVVIVCLLLAFLLYYLISTRLFSQMKAIAEDTKIPVICNERKKFKFEFSKTGNGERRSFSFWIYIHDMNKYKGLYKNVFNLNETQDNIDLNKSSPYICLDKNNNRLYIRFSKKNDVSIRKYSELDNQSNFNTFMQQGITIPYIPLQRWVHIAIVCNANSYKNYMYAYVDGDLVSSMSTGEKDQNLGNLGKEYRDLNLNIQGFLNIGGNPNDFAEGPGFSGLISKVTTYNYELNQKDIYDDYSSGPIGGILSRLGLSNYGVRSPIYKI